jgi:hypothetical protein
MIAPSAIETRLEMIGPYLEVTGANAPERPT